MGKIVQMLPEKKQESGFSVRFNSPLLVQKYREVIALDEQGMPGASGLRKQLFAAMIRRASVGDEFINAFLSTHE